MNKKPPFEKEEKESIFDKSDSDYISFLTFKYWRKKENEIFIEQNSNLIYFI